MDKTMMEYVTSYESGDLGFNEPMLYEASNDQVKFVNHPRNLYD